ncbi:MAG: hypothetical protein J5875_03875 [Paludibacteraceae bacterium]|nr:hypothetical protein [Paludibacteraceae bacterium]
MKQTQKYRQLSLFDDTEEKKVGTPLSQFEAPEEEQTPKKAEGRLSEPHRLPRLRELRSQVQGRAKDNRLAKYTTLHRLWL